MRKKNFKGRCEKRRLSKCEDVCRTYDAVQYAYADLLNDSSDIKSFQVNVLLDGLEGGYTSDFVCVKADNDLMVRECVERKHLTKPMTVKLLQASRDFWLRRGVSDWGIESSEQFWARKVIWAVSALQREGKPPVLWRICHITKLEKEEVEACLLYLKVMEPASYEIVRALL